MDGKMKSAVSIEPVQVERVREMPAYSAFKDIVYRKLRLLGLCLGLDVLQPDFRPTFMTAVIVFASVSQTLLFIITSVNAEGDLAVTAGAIIRLGFKVNYSDISSSPVLHIINK